MVGYNGGGAGDCDYPEPAYDSGPDLVLHQEDAPRDQGALFTQDQVRTAPNATNAALLEWLRRENQFLTIDELIAWTHSDHWAPGVCISCKVYTAKVEPEPGARSLCKSCGTWTVCHALDISTGRTPGPVRP